MGDEQESEESGEDEGEEEGTESDLVRTTIVNPFFFCCSVVCFYLPTVSNSIRPPQSTESKKRLKKKTKADSAWLRPSRKRKRRIKAKGDHPPPSMHTRGNDCAVVGSNIQSPKKNKKKQPRGYVYTQLENFHQWNSRSGYKPTVSPA